MNTGKAATTSHPIFFPAIWLMRRLSYPQKLILISLLFILPLGMALYTVIANTNNELQTVKREIASLEYIKALVPIFEAAQQHRGMRNALLKGEASFRQALAEKRLEINRLVNNMDAVDAQLNRQLKTGKMWHDIRQRWEDIESATVQPTPEESWARHTELIAKLIKLVLQIEAAYEMPVATHGETHYIITSVLEHLSQEIELIGQARGLGAGITATHAITSHSQFALPNLAGQIRLLFSETRHVLQAFGEKTAERQTLKAIVQKHAFSLDHFLTMLEKGILQPGKISLQSVPYFTAGTRAISTSLAILHSVMDAAKASLTARAASLSTEKMILQFTSAIAIIIAGYLLLALYFYVIRTVASLDIAARRMLAGNMTAPVEIGTHDELGQVVHSFNKIATALVTSSSNLKAVLNCAVDGIISTNEAGIIQFFNPAAEKIFGYPADEVIGNNVRMLMPESWRVAHDAGMKRYIKTGESKVIGNNNGMEAEGQRKDSSIFPLELTLNNMHVGDNRLFLGTVRDTSKRKRMEEENLHLAMAVKQAADAIIISDNEGAIQFINPAFTRLTGYRSQDVLGESYRMLLSSKQGTAFYQRIWNTISNGHVWKSEISNERKDGTLYEARITITPICNGDQNITRFLCMQHDITHEKKIKARMEHMQRLESLGVLAGGIAHDFNNILTAIMGNAALGRMKVRDTDPVLAHLVRIEEASQRAAELCKQMLAYSGKGRFVVKPLNLSNMVEEITKMLEVSLAKNVVLRFHLAENLPDVEADAAQLQQVIMNLVINASDAIGEKSGVISLSTGMMTADKAYLEGAYTTEDIKPERFVFLEVADTGCGMDEEIRKKVFEPFFTTKFTGRGLGMSAVLGIVQGHHGAIKVYSEVGQGTNFKILLPASQAGAGKQAQNKTRGEWSGAGTVLVVDDEETIRETVTMMLSDMGFDTLTAEDGEQGVEIYRRHRDEIVAVLLDMTMPKLDGKGCFRELRRINKDVCVILSSGYNEQDATNRFTGQGLAGFIQKPYTPEALRTRICEALGS